MALFEAVRRGFNLEDAPDSEKLFSSRFPSLLIAMRIKLVVSYSGAANQDSLFGVATHALGYIPAFFAFESSDNNSYKPSTLIYVDEQNVWVNKTETSGTKWILIYIFARPLLEPYRSEVVAPTGRGTNRESGPQILIAREGKDIESRDKRDFIVHPDTKTLPLHMTGYTGGGILDSAEWPKVGHGLGYSPIFYVYYISKLGSNKDGKAQFIWFLPNTDSSFSLSSNDEYFTVPATLAGQFAYMVMKDPI